MITLIIKGDMLAANAALAKHAIAPFTIEPHQKFREVIVRVHASTPWEVLARWFCERHANKAPYPDGVLLWYGPAYEGPKVANFYEPDMSIEQVLKDARPKDV